MVAAIDRLIEERSAGFSDRSLLGCGGSDGFQKLQAIAKRVRDVESSIPWKIGVELRLVAVRTQASSEIVQFVHAQRVR